MPGSMINQWLEWAQSFSKRAHPTCRRKAGAAELTKRVSVPGPGGDAHEDLKRYLCEGEAEAAFILHQRGAEHNLASPGD